MAWASSVSRDTIKAYGSFVASCILVIAATFDTCFNIYAVDLKKTFGYTQTELEFVASASMIGLFFALPCPLLLKNIGFNKTMVVTFLIAIVGMVMMGVCAKLPEIFSRQVFLFSIFQFMASNGNVYLLLIAIEISVTSFPMRHAGKLIGILNAFCSIGNVVYVGIYSTFFGDDGDVGGLFFTAAGMVTVTMIAYGILQNIAPPKVIMCEEIEPPSLEENHNLFNKNEKTSLISKSSLGDIEMKDISSGGSFTSGDVYQPPAYVFSFGVLITTGLFHLIAWPSAISETIGFLYMNNISSMLESLGIQGSRDPFIISLTLGSSVVRVLIGVLFDAIRGYNKRVALLISSSSLYILSTFILFLDMNNYWAVMFATVVSGFGIGIIITISLAFLTSMFGKQNNILVQGTFLTMTCFVQIGMHLIVGHFYDIAADHQAAALDPTLPECLNNFCFLWSLLLMIFMSALSIGMYIILYVIKDKLHLYR